MVEFVILLLTISAISARPLTLTKNGQRQAIYDPRVYELFEDTYGGNELWTDGRTSYFD